MNPDGSASMFHGLAAFPPTPADPEGVVDTDALGRVVERLAAAGVDSIGLLGSTGTYAYLSRTERQRAVAAAVDCVGGRVPVMVGVGALRTDAAAALARDAEAAGADALLLAPVSYTPLTFDEVFAHVGMVAAATRLPLCLYNNPTTTRFTFGRDLIARLSTVGTVRAVKMPLPADGDIAGELAALRRETPLAIGYSGDWGAVDALEAGADAWYSVIGGLLPRTALALTRSTQAGDRVVARSLDARLQPLWAMFRTAGSLRVVSALMPRLGLGAHHLPRPLLPLPEDDRRQVEAMADDLLAIERKIAVPQPDRPSQQD